MRPLVATASLSEIWLSMRRTLFLIPHEIAGLPVFGWGWLFGLIVIAAIVVTLYQRRLGVRIADFWAQNAALWAVFTAAVVWLMPAVELLNPSGEPVGLPVRGYGVMLLSGVVAAVGLAVVRARRYGIGEDVVLGIAPWAVVGGILGARAFYVIEYHDQFFVSDPLTTLRRIVNFTEGGLVVYGAFIGGFSAGTLYVWRRRLPVLVLGDVVAPTMFLGLALGRIGCLLNGCCYGGVCDDNWTALRFPNGSPVYLDQLESGLLVGIELSDRRDQIVAVRPGSPAAERGVMPGQAVAQFDPVRSIEQAEPDRPLEETPYGLLAVIAGVEHYWSAAELPPVAEPVRGTQVLSALGGLSLCLGLCLYSRYVHRPGLVMLTGFSGYAIMRFGMEHLRSDEPGQFGTGLTISQWVSLVVLLASAVGIAWLIKSTAGEPVDRQPLHD